jgi:hypothetical protein
MRWTAITPEECLMIENSDGEEELYVNDERRIYLEDAWSEVVFLLSDNIFQWNAAEGFQSLSLLDESCVDVCNISNIYTAHNYSLHTPEWVADISKAFECFSDKDFIERFNSKYYKTEKAKENVYRHGSHEIDELLDYYNYLKRFYIESAKRGDGIIYNAA